ncbi:MAG: ABC transporter permease [Caldilineales bacterium]|nr:ABC transporter permease [Caldilineales bacterium]
MTAFARHFSFEFKTGLRSSSAMLMNYLFPLAFYAMMGLVMTQINPLFKETMIPAMVIFTIMASCLLGLPNPLVESREKGVYRSFKINGVPVASILAVPTLTTIFHALIASALIMVTAPALFGGAQPLNWSAFVGLTLLTALTFGGIGALIGVIASSARAVVLWSQLIFLPSMLIGGLMMPLAILPERFQRFAALLPSTHAMQAFEGLAYDRVTLFDPMISVVVLAASIVISYGLAIYLFSWDSANKTHRGHPALALLAFAPYVVAVILM